MTKVDFVKIMDKFVDIQTRELKAYDVLCELKIEN